MGFRVHDGVWHSRLGQPLSFILKHLVSTSKVPLTRHNLNYVCHSYPLGKSKKLPFPLSNSISHFPLQLIHSNVWTSSTFSISGFRYCVIFIDDYSRYTWLYPLKLKSDVLPTFIKFKTEMKNKFQWKIQTFQIQMDGR